MSIYNAPAQGLYTSTNPFTSSPPGSLAVGNNVMFIAPGVLASRRGFEILHTFGAEHDRMQSMAWYRVGNDSLLVGQYGPPPQFDDVPETSQKLTSYNPGAMSPTFTDYSGTFFPVDFTASRMRFVGAAQNLYFNTTLGVKFISGISGTPAPAGVPPGLMATVYNTSANGWQSYDTAVAYEYCLATRDSFNRTIVGAPSGRVTLQNLIHVAVGGLTRTGTTTVAVFSGLNTPHFLSVGDTFTLSPGEANFAAGVKTVASVTTAYTFTYTESGSNVSSTATQDCQTGLRAAAVTCYLPSTATAGMFVQLFRSEQTLLAADEPSEELFQVYESAALTNTDISNGYLVISDITPESRLDTPLYTNPNTGELGGLLQANYQPPVALDMAYWGSRMWFANTTDLQRLELALLGVGSPAGLQNNDTITIDGTVYTAKTSPGADPNFFLYTLGTPAQNIERTARELVRCINRTAANTTINAYYTSAANDVPGKMLLTSRALGAEAFHVTASRATCWNPQLGSATSDNNAQPAGLTYSKLQEPESVPVTNFLPVDAPNAWVRRIHPLADKLYVFKTDGIWVVTSKTAPFQVQKISAAVLLSADSVAELGEKLYAITDQGIVTVSDGGVSVLSVPIETDITAKFGDLLQAVKTYGFAIGYQSLRAYSCWLPETDTTTCASSFVYSTLARGFTRWTAGATSAAINAAEDKLYIGDAGSNSVWVERKTFDSSDYADPEFTVTISGIDGTTLSLTDASEVTAGDMISQTLGDYALVLSVDGNEVEVDDASSLSAASATVYPAINCEVTFNPITGGDPAVVKDWKACSVLFETQEQSAFTVDFSSELSPAAQPVIVEGEGWGEGPWGDFSWGNPPEVLRRIAPLPVGAAMSAQLSVGLQFRQALRGWRLAGIALDGVPESDKPGGRR